MSDLEWTAGKFTCAFSPQAVEKSGFVCDLLGLYEAIPASPKGRRPARWCLIHLNTGHAVAYIFGNAAVAQQKGSEIRGLADWSFHGLTGWKNMDPDLPAKIRAVATLPSTHGSSWQDDGQARAIGSGRAQ